MDGLGRATVKGHLFVTLEDEEGLVNLIVRPDVYERCREVLRNTPLLWVEGRLQREGHALSVLVYRAGVVGDSRNCAPDSRAAISDGNLFGQRPSSWQPQRTCTVRCRSRSLHRRQIYLDVTGPGMPRRSRQNLCGMALLRGPFRFPRLLGCAATLPPCSLAIHGLPVQGATRLPMLAGTRSTSWAGSPDPPSAVAVQPMFLNTPRDSYSPQLVYA